MSTFLHPGGAAVLPPALAMGDLVAIVSPASKIAPELIDGAAAQLISEGFRVRVMPHARGEYGSFSADREGRLADLREAILDPEVRAILCSRGGYGAVHLIEDLDIIGAEHFRKWLIGFSDITALHALWHRKGVASLHAAMAKYIGRGPQFECYGKELAMLTTPADAPDAARVFASSLPVHPFNRAGECAGPVLGGNLAVLGGLIGTPYMLDLSGAILFIEDIAEPIYKVERILWQLRLAGAFSRLAGLMVGQFTDYRPSSDHPDMETMIARFVEPYSFPCAFGLPFGHIEANAPLLLGAPSRLDVGPSSAALWLALDS